MPGNFHIDDVLYMKTSIKAHLTGINIDLLVQSGTSQNKFVGLYGDRLKVKVTAKAIDGAANEAAIKLISKYFGVSKSAVRIVRGLSAREKTIEISGNPTVLAAAAEKLLFL